MDPQTQMDISNLSDADKKDLSQILQNESQKTTIQQSEYYTNAYHAYHRVSWRFGSIWGWKS